MSQNICNDVFQQNTRVFIPDDLIVEILWRLPVRSVGRFRCVSKSWLSITTASSFIRAHTTCNRGSQSLMSSGGLYKFPLDSVNEGITLSDPPKMDLFGTSIIKGSCDGLILSRSVDKDLFYIFNPLTGSFTVLKDMSMHYFMGFYFHHSTSKYHILQNVVAFEFSVWVVGEKSWREIPCKHPYVLGNHYPVDAGGNLHWLSWNRLPGKGTKKPPDSITAFNKETEIFTILPLPPSEDLHGWRDSLLDLDGKLGFWAAGGYNNIMDVWIFEKCWIKRHSVSYFDVKGCPSSLEFGPDKPWSKNFAIFIRNEELVIAFPTSSQMECVRWNLKSRSFAVPKVEGFSSLSSTPQFPHLETLMECPKMEW